MGERDSTDNEQFSDPLETGLRRHGHHSGVAIAVFWTAIAGVSCSLLVTELVLTGLGLPGVVGSVGSFALFTAAVCALAYAWWRVTKWSYNMLYE